MAELDRFLSVIVKHGGSDLHIGEGQPPKMRVHGDIMPIRDEPISREEATRMLSEVSGPRNWEIFEQRGDLDFAYEMDEASRFRSNYFKQSDGYGAAWKQFHSLLRRLRPVFSYSARCTQIMRARRLTGWWMFFRLIANRRRAPCWRTHFAAWLPNCF